MTNAITGLGHANTIISNLQSALEKERKQLNIARAIIFDLPMVMFLNQLMQY